jgi:hypothetical protein
VPYASWSDVALALALGTGSPSAAELVRGLDRTWHLMANCLACWSPADMRQTFPDDWDGVLIKVPRTWVVWHVLERDLHHGGEVSLALGMHRIQARLAV